MDRYRGKSKGLSTTEKSPKVDYITEKIVEIFGDGFATLKQNRGNVTLSDDEILAAFPSCVDKTFDTLLNIGKNISGKKGIFSEESLREEAKKLLLSILRDTSHGGSKEVIRDHVEELLTSLSNYAKTYDVYVPLHGLTLSKEVQRLKLGDASILRMDEDFFHALGKQTDFETPIAKLEKATIALKAAENSERLENELSAREKEAAESEGRSIDYETEMRNLKARKSSLQLELKETKEVQLEVAMLREKIAMLHARLELLREEIGTLERNNVASRDERKRRLYDNAALTMKLEEEARCVELKEQELLLQDAEEKEGHYHKLLNYLAEVGARLELTQHHAVETQKRIADLNAELVRVTRQKTEPSHILRERIDRLKADITSAQESRTLINRFKQSSCLQYRYNAEWRKAKEFAERDAASLIDFLRYAIAATDVSGENVLFGRQGEVVRDIPTFFAIESGTTDFQEMPSTPTKHPPLEITQAHVTAMKDEGIFEMAALLTKEPKQLNSLERILMRCIHWYSLSQIQPDRGSELLSLVIVLETLLAPEDRAPLAASISECVAMLLDGSAKGRNFRKDKIKQIYNVRSRLVHGQLEHDDVQSEDLEYLRATSKDLISIVWNLHTNGRLAGDEQKDLIRLINQAKFDAPPIT